MKGRSSSRKHHLRRKGHEEQEKKVRFTQKRVWESYVKLFLRGENTIRGMLLQMINFFFFFYILVVITLV